MKRMRCLIIPVLFILACLMLPWAMPVAADNGTPSNDKAGSMTLVLSAGQYTVTKDKDGLDVIEMEGFSPTTSPGDPMLPHKAYDIIVPPDIAWQTLKLRIVSTEAAILEGEYDIKPAPPLAPMADDNDDKSKVEWGEGKEIINGKNMKVYATNADFPEAHSKLLPYSQMRKWKYTKVDFAPFQYNPVSKQLTLIRSVTIEISYQQSGIKPQASLIYDKAMDGVAPQIFLNYGQAKGMYQADAEVQPQAPTYDYVIITTSAIQTNSTRLASFVAHKQSKGTSVLVVNETQWGAVTGQTPDHKAEKIRKWLQDNYISYGIQNVLLIGNPTPYEGGEGDVPMKMCWPRWSQTSYRESPTDYFYADLTGNWDLDADGYYGESPDDTASGGVDLAAEVYVGRIPVYSADYASLDNILQKIIDYETEGNINWRKNALLPMSFSDASTDGAPLAEQMKTNYLNAAGYSSWRMYQQGSPCPAANSSYTSEQDLIGGTGVRDRWAADDYGIVYWWGHGNSTIAAVGYSGCDNGILFQSSYCSSLDDDHPSFTYQCSCTNGYPESSSNLQYSILKRGGIGTVGATRVSWYSPGQTNFVNSPTNAGIGYEYVRRLVANNSAAPALYTTMQSLIPVNSPEFLMNCFDFNLYGDPTTSLASAGGGAGQKLIGADVSDSGSNQHNSGYIFLSRFAAESSGNITQIRVKSGASGNVKVAIYSDSGSEPGSLLNATTSGTPVLAGWNTVSIPSTVVMAGTNYWLAVRMDAAGAALWNAASGTGRYKSGITFGAAWPDPAAGGYDNGSFHSLLAGWGTIQITPPSVTNSSGASNITSTSARLNGELTANGGADTTVHVCWGDNDGVTTLPGSPGGWDTDVNLGIKTAGAFYTDISSLSNGTTYYYRCYATNSAGTTWASSTSSFVAQNHPIVTKLIGADVGDSGSNTHNSGYIFLSRFTAESSGNITEIRVKSGTSGNIKAAIYADSGSEPGALLNAATSGTPVAAGWNAVSIPSTAVMAGTNYWLAVRMDTAGAALWNAASGNMRYKGGTDFSAAWPNPAGSGYASGTFHSLLAGWGTVVITPPSVTNSTGASNITSTSARLNGELTSTGGADTTVHICWGDNDAGTGTWDTDVNLGIKTAGAFYTDTSDLSNGTTYYCRCYATNSAGTTWASSTSSFVAQSVPPMTKLIGADVSDSGSNTHNSGYIFLSRFTAESSGNITEIRVKSGTSGNIKAAIYADSGVEPGALLNAATSGTPVIAGWNTVTIPSTAVAASTNYWLAIRMDTAGAALWNAASGVGRYRGGIAFGAAWPNPAGGGYESYSFHSLLAGWGTPPEPPPPPTLLSPGTAITFKWGTATGATNYQLQVNTASNFTGTDMFNAEVGNVTTQEVTGLSLGTTYYWRVRAGNAGGWGNWSSARSVVAASVP